MLVKVFLLSWKRGMNKKGRSPSERATSGKPTFEPKNMPATQAQLI